MIDRLTFIRSAAGSVALAFFDRSDITRLLPHPSLEHPEPREGITSEHVLSSDALGKLGEKEKVAAGYEAARAHPELFDGLACACSCGGKKGSHRSLLSCYETLQPTGCGGCQEEAEIVAKGVKESKTLAEIRAAVDKWAS